MTNRPCRATSTRSEQECRDKGPNRESRVLGAFFYRLIPLLPLATLIFAPSSTRLIPRARALSRACRMQDAACSVQRAAYAMLSRIGRTAKWRGARGRRVRREKGREERHARRARRGNSSRNLDVITPVYRVNSRLVIAISGLLGSAALTRPPNYSCFLPRANHTRARVSPISFREFRQRCQDPREARTMRNFKRFSSGSLPRDQSRSFLISR